MGSRIQSTEFKFWKYTKKGPGCWLWTGTPSSRYALLSTYDPKTLRKSTVHASRVAWELLRGPIRKGLCVLHKCDNPRCVNPKHLFLGTNADNTRDMLRKGRAYGGERHHTSKLTNRQVARAILLYQEGWTLTRVAKKYGVTTQCIYNYVNGKTRRV